MGNHTNNMELQSLHENWVTAAQPTSSLHSHINLYRTRLLVNTVTLDYIEEYNLYFSCEQQFKQYLHETEWRRGLEHRDPLAYIPPIRAFINTSTVELCSHSYSASIYFDKVEMKLQEINDIPFRDAMYMMRICLEGFKLLMDHFGTFRVTEDMVFINRDGEVKVWISADLSSIVPNKRDYQQIANIRQYNSNNPIINLRQSNRQIIRESTNKFSTINSFDKITSSPPQTRQIKVSKSTSLNRKNQQQLIHSRNSQNQHDSIRYQNKRYIREISQQNMIKDILKIVQDNIDIEALQKRIKIMEKNKCRFMMFSQFIKQCIPNQNMNNSFTRNNNSFSTGVNRTQQQIVSSQVPSKIINNGKNVYKFENVFQLYNRYIREFAIKVPRKMEVIFDIFRNRFTERLEGGESEINEVNDVYGTDCQNDEWGAIDTNLSYDQKDKNGNKLLKSVNHNKQTIKMVNSIDQSNNGIYKQKEKSIPLGMRETKISQEYRMSYGNENAKKIILSNHNMGNTANIKERSHKNVNNFGQLIQHNNFQTHYSNIFSNSNKGTNKGGIQQQFAPQNSTQTLQQSSFASLINNKTVPVAQININININNNCNSKNHNHNNSPYSHVDHRGSSLDQKSSVPPKCTNVPNKTNVVTISNSSISNNSNNNAKCQLSNNMLVNSINHQNPLSVLLQEHYHSDDSSHQHRLVKTNHIQRSSNDENITQLNNRNIKIGHYRINNIHNMNVSNKCGMQSPKLQSSTSTTSDNKICNNIIYLRTPSKLGQKQVELPNNIYMNSIGKPNSVNIPANTLVDNNNQYQSIVTLTKPASKIEKYIIHSSNNYFSKNNTTLKESIGNSHKNNDNVKIQKNGRLDMTRNVCNVGKVSNTNIEKETRVLPYKLNGGINSLVKMTESLVNPHLGVNSNSIGVVPSSGTQNPGKSQLLQLKQKAECIIPKQKNQTPIKEKQSKKVMHYSFIDSYELDSQIADDLQLICPQHEV